MTCLRSSVADIEATMASHFFSRSAGMMPSQSTFTSSQVSPIWAQSAWPMSTSKPTTVPSGATSEKGG